MEALTLWIISVVIGCLIGVAKGRFFSGLVWSTLFGPVGVLIVLCLKNLAKEKKEAEEKERMMLYMAEQRRIQNEQLEQMKIMAAHSRRRPMPTPMPVESLRIGSDGKDIGDIPLESVRAMLGSGKLSLSDVYYDWADQQWMPLSQCRKL